MTMTGGAMIVLAMMMTTMTLVLTTLDARVINSFHSQDGADSGKEDGGKLSLDSRGHPGGATILRRGDESPDEAAFAANSTGDQHHDDPFYNVNQITTLLLGDEDEDDGSSSQIGTDPAGPSDSFAGAVRPTGTSTRQKPEAEMASPGSGNDKTEEEMTARPKTTGSGGGGSDDSECVKIAVGIIVPLMVLLLLAFLCYCVSRREARDNFPARVDEELPPERQPYYADMVQMAPMM
ncbi:uncharacterized protein LOC143286429 [Babylonia areolata]|uniref:uncharacterized protein LOC143286429 n=1 Tax=Babylonia areolata TaxID=304850 RepID=UPI003FD40093